MDNQKKSTVFGFTPQEAFNLCVEVFGRMARDQAIKEAQEKSRKTEGRRAAVAAQKEVLRLREEERARNASS